MASVYRARDKRLLREVAVKIQYPLIDQIVKADLKNLRTLLKALFGLVSDIDFEPIWSEVRDRLLEELDYEHEAEAQRRFAAGYDAHPEVVVPDVDESRYPDEEPSMFVERVARAKAAVVDDPDAVIIAADTTVVFEGRVLGKPAHPNEAMAMLSARGLAPSTMIRSRTAWRTNCVARLRWIRARLTLRSSTRMWHWW